VTLIVRPPPWIRRRPGVVFLTPPIWTRSVEDGGFPGATSNWKAFRAEARALGWRRTSPASLKGKGGMMMAESEGRRAPRGDLARLAQGHR